MIDFVRLRDENSESLNEQISDYEKFNNVIGVYEVNNNVKLPTKYASYGDMKVKVTNSYGVISGSLHKHWNFVYRRGSHNHNGFTYINIIETISSLSKKIINSNKIPITKLEVGFNLELNQDVDSIIQNNFIMHKEEHHSAKEKFKGRGLLKRFVYTEYDIKIYNKGRQYELDKNILRFEVVLKGKRVIRRYGVYNLEDLKRKEILRRLFLLVRQRLSEMVILDNFYDLNSLDRNLLYKYTNPIFWRYHIANTSDANKSKHRKQFKNIIEECGIDHTKKKLINKLNETYLQLING